MRCSGFVMTDESGKVLAVSVDGSADLVKSLAGGKVAPETPAEMVAEHERLVDVLRSPSHEDDLEEADRQEAELAEYRKQAGEELSKAHVRSYTRKDGTFVKEHDDQRQAAQPKQSSGGGASYDHPNVVGKADFGGKSPEKHYAMNFAGTEYMATGKTGNSMHDQTPVREFESDDGHRVWADHAGRVHADDTSEVAKLRQRFEAHSSKSSKPQAGGYVAPKEGEVGHHEHTQYGAFFRPGDKVRDGSGKEHEVMEHRGAEVKTYGGGSFHPTKLKHVSSKAGGSETPAGARAAQEPESAKPRRAAAKTAPAEAAQPSFKRGDKVKVHKPGQLSHGVEGSVLGPSKTKPDHVSIKTLDGKLVSHHKDDLVPAAKPETGKHTSASLSVLADQHVAEAQRHERLSSKKGADHQDYEHHVVASALHSKAQRHAEKAASAADGSPEREAHLNEYRRLKGMIERREDAIGETGKPMAKALLFVPVGGGSELVEAAKSFVRKAGDQ